MSAEILSLYIDLEDDRVADIEGVARAAISFSQTVKEIAYIIDPSLEVRVELVSGTASSLNLKSLVRELRAATDDPVRLKTIIVASAAAIILWTGLEVGSWTVGRVLDHFFSDGEQAALISDDQLQQIADALNELQEGQVGVSHARQIFQELERDPAIRGVGVNPFDSSRPDLLIPRGEFSERSAVELETLVGKTRIRPERVWLRVTRVILEHGKRRWGFEGDSGRFGAPVLDEEFIDRVLSGGEAIPIVEGLRLEVLLEIEEEYQDGVWVIHDRRIRKVFNHESPRIQADLLASLQNYVEPPDSTNENGDSNEITSRLTYDPDKGQDS